MNESDFIRYSRQILLKDISISGQKKLLDSRVLIVGLGGLGAPASLYLAGAGIGSLIIADSDEIHLSNLQRQILFTTEDIGKLKSCVTKNRLQGLNPEIQIIAVHEKLTSKSLHSYILNVDLVLDCTDNIITRKAINSVCVATNTPLITASAIGFRGMIMVLTPPWYQGCYHCLCPDNDEPEQRNCPTSGIIGPVVGIMGTLQALEAIILLSGMKNHSNNLKIFDARSGNWHNLALQKSTECDVCGDYHANSF